MSPAAYQLASKRKLLPQLTSHMSSKIANDYSYEDLLKIALKYKTNTEFMNANAGAYSTAVQRKIIDDITKHMVPVGSLFKRMVYVYEFPDNHVYVGLTYNQKKREYGHLRDVRSSVYQHILKTKIEGNLAYVTSRYPEVPLSENDIYVYTTQGDRFDILAQQYYKNSSLWWVISIANTGNAGAGTLVSLPQNSLIIPEGIQIRIPSNYANVIRNFNAINA